ncbi:T9SS type A sorting domain-containing protein [Chryseobacterium sp. OSA05B]|uniref:T9SS type A sorting domain-containing protein n=1 Tax=Chryseobacterium sp. OSA05B TaxID=2862650 RepID=UPI001CBAAD91|nr:T9SS type A sorting domain-containing protein [Chryseobacterium sp. OSA05B]
MKTKVFLFILSLSGFIGFGQTKKVIPRTKDIQDNTLQSVFANLEKDRIPNGLLLDAAIEFANLKKYDGTMPDSSYTSSKLVADIYNTVLMSRLSANATITHTSDALVSQWKAEQQMDIIPLGGVFYKYSQFSQATQQNAQNTGDPGTLTVTNGTVQDKYVNGVWQNPYEEKYVLALSPSVSSHNKLNFKIKLPNNLFLTNQTSQIQKIEYKLSDQLPYEILPYNQLINVSYAALGTYHWTFKVTLNSGEVLYTHTQFTVNGDMGKYVDTAMESKNTNLGQYTKNVIFNGANRATMYIKLAPGHTQITKPLIVAEGFDMGAIVAPTQEAGLTNIDTFISSLWGGSSSLYFDINNGYDIIYVDWNNGVDYIQNNAALLSTAIQWVNAKKSGMEPNVVIGQSMGGLVARYALKDMEQKGIPHVTKLFISDDSPHLGANIPLGMQYMLINVARAYIRTPLVAGIGEFIVPMFNQGISINDVLTLTDTPAARQMLINYADGNYQLNNTIHDNWQNELKLKGYPQLTRNVAISNGSECGTDQTLSNLLRLYKETNKQHMFSDIIGALVGVATNRLDMILLSSVPGSSKYVFDFTVRPMTQLNAGTQVYNGSIKYKKKVLWLINAQVTLLGGSRTQPGGILPIDKYGGGKFKLAQNQLPSYVTDNLTTTPFSFIPTPSALDYKSGNTVLTEADYQRPFSPIDDAANVPFANFVAEKVDANQEHITFSARNGQFILNQLSTNTAVQNQKITSSYLCGSKIKIGGDAASCGATPLTYTTGFAPSISWSIVNGAGLVDINGPTDLPQITFTPKPYANGNVRLQALLSGDGASNSVTKDVWIGAPMVYMQNYCTDPSQTMCYLQGITTSFPVGSTISLSLDAAGLDSIDNSGNTWEWEKVMGNFKFVGSPYVADVQNNGNGSKGKVANLQATGSNSTLAFKGRAKSACGWGPWKWFYWNIYSSRMMQVENYFMISPNPTDDIINISLLDPTNTSEIKTDIQAELYNPTGNRSGSIKLNNFRGTMSASGLLPGVYTLKIIYNGKSETHQIIKK